MEVSRGQLLSGATRFVRNEIASKVPDKNFKMVLIMLANLIEVKPELADEYFKPMANSNGMYDLELFEAVVCRTMDEYGEFVVSFPAIKFISPTEKELRFNADDVRKLKDYIRGE